MALYMTGSAGVGPKSMEKLHFLPVPDDMVWPEREYPQCFNFRIKRQGQTYDTYK